MAIRIVLVDDTSMFRDGLQLVIERQGDMTVVGQAADGAESLPVIEQTRPDIVLMDIRMPVMDGVEATRRIRTLVPSTHVLVLTTYSDDEYLVEALKAGAAGCLLKDMQSRDLIQAIRAVHQGGVLILPPMAARLLSESTTTSSQPPAGPEASRLGDLTPRESEILKLVAHGLTNREIADRLHLTEGTVKNHMSAVYAKLHARDRAQAVSFAMRQGLLE
ncbi:MAG TPA: response regulator transcription factor [Symbiobacteriaceae bacterium]|jgi:DNA-binding NarL/FixJ family response regulator